MNPQPNVPTSERGAALLSILLLVAILSVIAATTLDRVILSTKLSGNGQAMRQARLLAYAAEGIALARLADLRAPPSGLREACRSGGNSAVHTRGREEASRGIRARRR